MSWTSFSIAKGCCLHIAVLKGYQFIIMKNMDYIKDFLTEIVLGA